MNPVAPWHMWGSSALIEATQVGALSVVTATAQLSKVSYRRPDTWAFWLGARLIGGDAPPVAQATYAVRFTVSAGLGRSIFATEPPPQPGMVSFNDFFCEFRFVVPVGVVPGLQVNNVKYTTQVTTPPLNDNVATSTQTLDRIVAEEINVQANLYIVNAAVGTRVLAEATSFIAPWSHVRPDWLHDVSSGRQFLGGETGGT